MRNILAIVVALLPGKLKRFIYIRFFGYSIHPNARIGLSLITCENLVMDEKSKIGHLNVIKGLKTVELGAFATLGNLNWITGFPLNTTSEHFRSETSRSPCLFVGDHSAITHRHLIDCTNTVSIGRFSTFAGFRSQILTHSISIQDCAQRSAPIEIGDYCFVGTGSILLPSASLPSYSVLGAGSLLNKAHTKEYFLYGGIPAYPIKELDKGAAYFHRHTGYVK
jgi:acetyltransferase-like isoleucine patch superfamily enzyme